MQNIAESLASLREFTNVEDALVVDEASSVPWDEETDFIVVGYGGAGVAAANQAIDEGLDVIALDRFEGGGATVMNGGVIYAGGGTSVQTAAGYDDTPAAMFEYLSQELQGIVTAETLQRFCEESPEMIDWLEAHGVCFDPTVYTEKTSFPPAKYYLYFPDNSLLAKYRGDHPPAPRGHKVKVNIAIGDRASGFGHGIFEPQRQVAAAAGVRVYRQADVRQLVVDRSGSVVGLKAYRVLPDNPHHAALVKAQRAMQRWLLLLPSTMPGAQITAAVGNFYGRKAARIEERARKPFFLRARRGICLANGGFIFNKAMVRRYAPAHQRVLPLGTVGDDGSGIMLGRSVAGALGKMNEVSSWRFLNPPPSWAKGVLVNARGARYTDEASYGATVGRAMMQPGNDGVAWLILDAALWNESKSRLKTGDMYPFQRQPASMTMMLKSKRAPSLAALAKKLGFDQAVFAATMMDYHRAKAGEMADAFAKAPSDMGAMAQAPYYAIDLGVSSPFFPLPSITVGGLLVDENSGLVLREDGTTIPGLYAAGRTAVGLCSNLYLSGLSVADCIFAGRRAGKHAADRSNLLGKSTIGVSAVASPHASAAQSAVVA